MAEPIHLAVSGMHCDGCSAAVERVLRRVPGVSNVTVAFPAGRAVVEGTTPAVALIDAIAAAGYGATLDQHR